MKISQVNRLYNIGIEKEKEKKYIFIIDKIHVVSIIVSVKREAKRIGWRLELWKRNIITAIRLVIMD